MNEIVSNLLVYGSLPEDSILWQLADICEKLKDGTETKAALRGRVFHQVKNLLTVATDYAFDKNLWHNYLTFLLITNENPFSLVCEKMGAQEGTVNNFVTHDFDMFKELFDYDFSWLEKELSIDCFTQLTHYQAIRKKELMYNKNVSEKVRTLSEKLETAESGADFFQYVTEFYKDYGVGMFGLNKAFRIAENKDGSIRFLPITTWIPLCWMISSATSSKRRNSWRTPRRSVTEKRRTTCCYSATAVPVNPPASRPSSTSSTPRACA